MSTKGGRDVVFTCAGRLCVSSSQGQRTSKARMYVGVKRVEHPQVGCTWGSIGFL